MQEEVHVYYPRGSMYRRGKDDGYVIIKKEWYISYI